ncbi:MAG TPA: virulence factor SrfB, partial [Candidatus Ozemobacteraceae bacterium]|nr:virulence factor SrfB [Candidatus Ozemobacteraceae bacterium]
LQSGRGAISLQSGSEAISNATAPDQEVLTDIGGLVVRFHDVLRTCIGKWLPLPYHRKGAAAGSPCRSLDWVRVMVQRPPLQTDDRLYRVVLAVDTRLQPAGRADVSGFANEDVGFPFELNPGSIVFWQNPGLLSWVKHLFQMTPVDGSDKAPPFAAAMASYMALMDGFQQAEILPEITFLHPEGEVVDVSLVLDLGNSRACGILAEQVPGTPVSLDECCKLEIRDLRDPSQVYTEPFDTSFKFQPPLFQEPDNAIPQAGGGFSWPSLVRLGQEAAKLEPCDVGDTGMSSPKRYLWDENQRHFPWYLNLADAGLGKKISAGFLKFLDENGVFRGDKAQPPFEPCYPPSSLMTFLMMEILNHAFAQINSYSFRKSRGHRLACRVLKNVVITTPCGMSKPEREKYRQRVQSAIDTVFHVMQLPAERKPKLFLDFDEATAIQLTYLFGEVKHRFLGDARDAIATLGAERRTSSGAREPVLRIASIDIGGGTSDLMIAEYAQASSEASGVRQRMLFSEGFSVAGDEIAK